MTKRKHRLEGKEMAHPLGEQALVEQSGSNESMALDSFGGRIHVRWSPDEAVTPLGQLPFFIDFLKQADLFDPFIAACPLLFSSPNAPRVRDVVGTQVLAIVAGAWRYAHVSALRHDGINPPLLGMSKVCSDDSVRRALESIDQEKAEVWLKQHLTVPLHPMMQEGWILDMDTRSNRSMANRRVRRSVTTHTSPDGPRIATIPTCSPTCAWFWVSMSTDVVMLFGVCGSE